MSFSQRSGPRENPSSPWRHGRLWATSNSGFGPQHFSPPYLSMFLHIRLRSQLFLHQDCSSYRLRSKLSDSAERTASEVNANVGELLSTIETHLVSPARNREWPAHVAVPAAKEPLKHVLYSMCHRLMRSQFALHFEPYTRSHALVLGLGEPAFASLLNGLATRRDSHQSALAFLKR
jgi:hypothetical protein